MNTSEFLNIASLIVPERVALVFEGRRFTYEEVAERVNKLANALAGSGVGKGDRVAMIQVNCNEHVEAYFASAKLDAVYVPLNFRLNKEELERVLKDSSPSVLISGMRYTEMIDQEVTRRGGLNRFVVLDGLVDGWLPYEDLIDSASTEERLPESDGVDLTMLMFTAGTTGNPKGVMLSHGSFSSYILSNVNPVNLEHEEKNILAVPLYHIAGVQAMMAAIYGGRTLVIQKQFEPCEWMRLVEQEEVDRAMMVPTMLKMVLDHPGFPNHDLSSLSVITYGAASMPLELIRRAINMFPDTRFINAFGQTETAATITMLSPEDHILEGSPEEMAIKISRLTSIGKPLEDVEVQIVDENQEAVAVGDIGEIMARGPRLMSGYWNQQEETAEALKDGWLHTGDLGYFDEDGYIFLSGRAKDFIKRGGEMISPEEVEQVIQAHPAVDEVAVIGVPDLHWGERVRAIVVNKPGCKVDENDVIEYCRLRLSSFKKPESVIVVEELPRNPLGKVLKTVLKDQFTHPI